MLHSGFRVPYSCLYPDFRTGALSFIIATASGVIFVKIFNLVLGKDNKINPLIGNAGVSAVPDSARISQVIG